MKAHKAKWMLLGSVATLAAASGSAMAADLGPYQPYNPPPPEPAPIYQPAIWDGAYIGANGGYGWSNGGPTEPDGGFGGGQIGYNWQRDRIVFGLEGDIQGGDISGTAFTFDGDTARSNMDWFSTVRGRLGFASGPWLIYATGGVAFADIDNRVNLVGAPSFHDDSTQTGYAVGGGVEWAFAPKWSLKAEYLYLGFGDDNLHNADGDTFKVNNDVQTVRVGLNYHF
ncbi:outer membrane protein [Hyphomicrobium sp.]|jgi:outer membrane immunogenic protein|uniref:outer membrane protein n=1 Tax=Hyphomicrobium sp. TaxID=82 RepID=UPI002C8EF909|nr:outer membrane protein [Hyphomicrobium sp.]HVZ06101.1 outer membrane protein [Hyphomicrobium sp.]